MIGVGSPGSHDYLVTWIVRGRKNNPTRDTRNPFLPDKNKKTKIEMKCTNVSSFKKKDLTKFRNQNLGFFFQFHKFTP